MKTEIIEILDPDKSAEELIRAAQIIKRGGLVVFPTETVYGLGADACNSDATRKIYEAKGRPSDNPLIIHIADPSDADKYAFANSAYYLLAEKFMPGPLTVILRSREIVPLSTRGGLETVAVRCPENRIARKLIELSGVPIAAPSANLSGSPSPTNASHVIRDMSGRVDLIIDGGDSDFGLESTIVKVDGDDSVTLLRPGKITVEDLEETGLKVNIARAVSEKLQENEKAISPGMKYKHYAPRAPLYLIDGEPRCICEYIKNNSDGKTAVLAYTEDMSILSDSGADIYDFGSRDSEISQAHLLFKLLRDTDMKDYSKIFAPVPSEKGIGLALYNRMIRAAAHKIIRL